MTRMIVVSLPVADLGASAGFYKALGFEMNMQFSDATAVCMVWSTAIQLMLLSRRGIEHAFNGRLLAVAA